jgi:hypothetical protein
MKFFGISKMARSSESFKGDRAWHTTDLPDPDDCVTLRQQQEYQRLLWKKWEATELPSDLPFAPMNAPWWQRPYDPDPAALLQQQIRRLSRKAA